MCSKAGEVKTSRFLSDSSLEVANREVIDKGHLGLNPVSEGLVRKASGIKDNEFIGVDNFADLS